MSVAYPKIAVLLAAYNGISWIEEQVNTVLSQAGVDVVLYISVDLSTDRTYEWCEALATRHQKVILLPVGSFGGAARNFFRLFKDVDFSDFDFVALADQDDVWHSDKLQRAAALLGASGHSGYSSNVSAFWPDGRTLLLDKSQPQVEWDHLFEAAGPGCTYVLKPALAQCLKTGMLANWEQLQHVTLHDWYCYAAARSQGYTWFIDPVPSMQYRQHAQNQMGANTGLQSLLARYKTIKNGWWFKQISLIARLTGANNLPWVISEGRFGRLELIKLSFNAHKCRRRGRDKLLFFVICWVTAALGWRR